MTAPIQLFTVAGASIPVPNPLPPSDFAAGGSGAASPPPNLLEQGQSLQHSYRNTDIGHP